MLHYLSLGHFDPESIRQRQPSVTRPLDLQIVHRLLREFGEETAPGQFTLGGHRVAIADGYVTCAWLMPHRVPETTRFALVLVVETDCLLAEIRSGTVIPREDFGREVCREDVDRLLTAVNLQLSASEFKRLLAEINAPW